MDQQLHQLHILRKSYKWYKKIFLRLTAQVALSAHKLYKLKGGQHDFLGYLHDIISQLIARAPCIQKEYKSLRGPVDNIHRLSGRNHWPGKRNVDVGRGGKGPKKKRHKCKMCRVCYARGIRTSGDRPVDTSWICTGCPSQPGLCVDRDCFVAYHTQFDYTVTLNVQL